MTRAARLVKPRSTSPDGGFAHGGCPGPQCRTPLLITSFVNSTINAMTFSNIPSEVETRFSSKISERFATTDYLEYLHLVFRLPGA